MNTHSVMHLLFVLTWAVLGFEVIRSLMKLTGLSRPIAASTAAAVAIAYYLGATGPLACGGGSSGDSAPSAPATAPVPATAARAVACPVNAIVSAKPGLGSIDTVAVGSASAIPKSAVAVVPAGTDVHLVGWAALKAGPGATLCAIDNGRVIAISGSYGTYRPDVAAATAISADNATGFSITLKPSTGAHVITVGAVEADGRSIDTISGSTLAVNVF